MLWELQFADLGMSGHDALVGWCRRLVVGAFDTLSTADLIEVGAAVSGKANNTNRMDCMSELNGRR